MIFTWFPILPPRDQGALDVSFNSRIYRIENIAVLYLSSRFMSTKIIKGQMWATGPHLRRCLTAEREKTRPGLCCQNVLKCSIIGYIRPLEVGMPGFSRFRLKKSQAVPAPLWLPQTADIYFSETPRLPFRQSFLPAFIPRRYCLSLSFAAGLICAVHRRRLCRADAVFPPACAHGRRHSSAKSVSRTVCSS
jgi:hypothetical protein